MGTVSGIMAGNYLPTCQTFTRRGKAGFWGFSITDDLQHRASPSPPVRKGRSPNHPIPLMSSGRVLVNWKIILYGWLDCRVCLNPTITACVPIGGSGERCRILERLRFWSVLEGPYRRNSGLEIRPGVKTLSRDVF